MSGLKSTEHKRWWGANALQIEHHRRVPGLARAIIACLSVLGLAACTSSITEEPAAQRQTPWPAETREYRCDDSTVLQVAYYPERELAGLWYQGQLSLMRQWRAASGIRYISLDEQVGYRWHVKGDEGALSWLAPDHTAQEVFLHRVCKEKPRTPVGGGEQGF